MATILSKGPGATDLSRQILEHRAPQYTFSFTPFLLANYRHGVSPDRPTNVYISTSTPRRVCHRVHTTTKASVHSDPFVPRSTFVEKSAPST
ncbi:mRNA 3 -end-processing yth-1 [Hyphodiscus hymeniophilus]|uniref:mRNA 3 -end-processing yth-1 n=1 Tax=Hyphodiscus hymeniophilus TaxID=353542 RepID=A0A9P6VQF9_9HELO|nr:mRNA 3 -end-processing yth-1 [Hyphodiscus hymeniophilus]